MTWGALACGRAAAADIAAPRTPRTAAANGFMVLSPGLAETRSSPCTPAILISRQAGDPADLNPGRSGARLSGTGGTAQEAGNEEDPRVFRGTGVVRGARPCRAKRRASSGGQSARTQD